VYGRTDGRDEANWRFCDHALVPKKRISLNVCKNVVSNSECVPSKYLTTWNKEVDSNWKEVGVAYFNL
jgi:hypothetical protein